MDELWQTRTRRGSCLGLLPAAWKIFSARQTCIVLTALCASAAFVSADTLIYNDGDRLTGKLVEAQRGEIVFRSSRFGKIRAKSSDARVEVEPVDSAVVGQSPPPVEVVENAAANRTTSFPASRESRNAWTGRIAIGTEAVRDASDRKSLVVDVRVERKWVKDQLRHELHYEYRTVDNAKQADDLKVSGYWKHGLSDRSFSVYHPTVEWNRYAILDNVFTPYVVVQQELGLGFTVLNQPTRKVAAGISENLFNGWAINSDRKVHVRLESAFLEIELKLPYDSKLIQRSVFYYSFELGRSGAESSVELVRQLTVTLNLGLQYQYQRNLPDLRLQNYERLRLLLGYDF